jgi:hypothetical protein
METKSKRRFALMLIRFDLTSIIPSPLATGAALKGLAYGSRLTAVI